MHIRKYLGKNKFKVLTFLDILKYNGQCTIVVSCAYWDVKYAHNIL